MNRRFLASLGVLAVVCALASTVPAPLAAQGQTSAVKPASGAKTWTPPRTPWGEPDLQGIWSYATLTPLERPLAMAGREFLTDEEVAARNAASVTDAPPRPGDTGTYNQVWFDRGKASRRTSQIVDPADGRLPPLTPEAQKRRARAEALRKADYRPDSWLDLQTDDRCIMYHGVPPQPSGYNNTYQIFQTPGVVAILDENIHHVRLITLDGRPHVPPTIRQWNGDSRGHWEGNTLVVETANYSEKTELRYPLQMTGYENTRAVERFTRVDADTIDYRFTIDDPTVYTRPWTAALPMARTDGRIYEYACHEGNQSMTGILSGARALDKAAEEAAKKKGSSK